VPVARGRSDTTGGSYRPAEWPGPWIDSPSVLSSSKRFNEAAYHSYIASQRISNFFTRSYPCLRAGPFRIWRGRRDSNSRPLPWQLVIHSLACAESVGYECDCRQALGSLGMVGKILCKAYVQHFFKLALVYKDASYQKACSLKWSSWSPTQAWQQTPWRRSKRNERQLSPKRSGP